MIVDATDNAASRYLISDACAVLNRPVVSGAALGTDGQLTVYCCSPDGARAARPCRPWTQPPRRCYVLFGKVSLSYRVDCTAHRPCACGESASLRQLVLLRLLVTEHC